MSVIVIVVTASALCPLVVVVPELLSELVVQALVGLVWEVPGEEVVFLATPWRFLAIPSGATLLSLLPTECLRAHAPR